MSWFAKKTTAKEQAMQAKRETRREVRVSFAYYKPGKFWHEDVLNLLKTESNSMLFQLRWLQQDVTSFGVAMQIALVAPVKAKRKELSRVAS